MNRPVFIFDPYTDGHHGTYNDLLIRGLLSSGRNVVLLSSRDIEHHHSIEEWRTLEPSLEVIILSDPAVSGRGARPWYFQEIHTYIQKYQPSHVYLQSLDSLLYFSLFSFFRNGRTFAVPWSAIYVIPKYQIRSYGPKSDLNFDKLFRLKESIRFQLLNLLVRDRSFIRIDMIDEAAVGFYNRRLRRPICNLIPDPVPDEFYDDEYDSTLIRQKYSFSDNDYIFLAYGVHKERKGTFQLIQSFFHMKLTQDFRNAKLILAGSITDERVRSLLQRDEYKQLLEHRDIQVDDRYISDEESLDYYRLSDCVCMPYVNHVGSSGVLLRALIMGKQVIATDQNWIGDFLSSRQLGIMCNQDSVPALSEAMVKAYTDQGTASSFQERHYYHANHYIQSLISVLSNDESSS